MAQVIQERNAVWIALVKTLFRSKIESSLAVCYCKLINAIDRHTYMYADVSLALSNPSLIGGSALCAFDHYSLRLLNSKVNEADLGTSIKVMRPPERRPGQVELTHCLLRHAPDVRQGCALSPTLFNYIIDCKACKATQGLRLVRKSMYLILLTPTILCS